MLIPSYMNHFLWSINTPTTPAHRMEKNDSLMLLRTYFVAATPAEIIWTKTQSYLFASICRLKLWSLSKAGIII